MSTGDATSTSPLRAPNQKAPVLNVIAIRSAARRLYGDHASVIDSRSIVAPTGRSRVATTCSRFTWASFVGFPRPEDQSDQIACARKILLVGKDRAVSNIVRLKPWAALWRARPLRGHETDGPPARMTPGILKLRGRPQRRAGYSTGHFGCDLAGQGLVRRPTGGAAQAILGRV